VDGANAIVARIILVTGYNPHHAAMAHKIAEVACLDVVGMLHKPVRLATLRNALAATA